MDSIAGWSGVDSWDGMAPVLGKFPFLVPTCLCEIVPAERLLIGKGGAGRELNAESSLLADVS